MQAGKFPKINKRAGCNKAMQVGIFQKSIAKKIKFATILPEIDKHAGCRGCLIKKWINALLYTIKIIDPSVKSHARGQNNRSRALKWGTVCLGNSEIIRDTIRNKKYNFFKFLHF